MRHRILFISSWYPNRLETTNGNFVQRHAEAVSLKNDVEVLHAIGDHKLEKKFQIEDKTVNNIRTVIVYYRNTPFSPLNFLRRMSAYRKGFGSMKRPDLVHANVLQQSMLFAVYLKVRFSIPFVVTEHWSGFLKANRDKLSAKAKIIAKTIAKNASFIQPVSNALKEDLQNLGLKNQFEVIGNVVDTDLFSLSDIENQPFTFLHISNLIKLKNPDRIIKTAAKLHSVNPSFELHIGGDGDVERLNNLVKELKAESFVKTFGEISLSEVAEKMKSSNCFILFSDYENFPCVLLEAASTGTPIIATNVGGIAEIVNAENGILIGNSEEELFNAMKKMLEGEFVFSSEKMRQEIIDNFSQQVIAEKFDRVYKKVLGA